MRFASRVPTWSCCRGDVADAESLQAASAQLPPDAPPLRGVIHAAGVLADGVLADMTLEQLDRAMSPKVAGRVESARRHARCSRSISS